eukprot:TRINITY_DN5917_c0_g1_i4.p1 TRINITY_DN5917_c0_g1~~TRINITY_DN5917_c0_g1_i4.p1  ORF type:complete len:773 (-),score=302.98 TRINITY_DN5917_c0_g1_i4:60-2378(-)
MVQALTEEKPTIIYPPPEVRNIVDKTAGFVARNGQEFEQRIKQNEVNNPKFNFLNSGDPYHAYYQHRVTQIREGKPDEKQAAKAAAGAAAAPAEAVAKKQSELLQSVTKKKAPEEVPIPKEPPPEYEFVADPPSISAFDLDVVKLTAQFVARNGRQFLTQLMNKEQRNYQFDFLRPQHSLFQYFTKLLEQYTKVLLPPKELQGRLDSEAASRTKIMEQVNWRVGWLRQEAEAKRKEEEALERERVAYSQIDWHNFVVVETVDYQPWEVGNFPPPTNPTEVGARILIQRRQEDGGGSGQTAAKKAADDSDSDSEDEGGEKEGKGADTQVQDMEEGSSSGESDLDDDEPVEQPEDPKFARERAAAAAAAKAGMVPAPPSAGQPPLPPPMTAPTPGNVVVKSYDPKEAAAMRKKVKDDEFLISPLTGERIPASKAAEHMKIGLLDSKWVEERDKQMTAKASEDVVFAPGMAIESNLKQLAERRSDIFGVGEGNEETYIGLKVGEEEQKVNEKNTWDGHSSSAEAAARAARKDVSLRDQIDQIHKQKGLIPDKERETRTVTVQPPPPPQHLHHQQAPVPPPPQPPLQQVARPLMMGVPAVRPAPPMLVPQQPMFIPGGPPGGMVPPPAPPQGPPMFMQQQRPGMPPGGPIGMPMAAGGGSEEPPTKRQKTEDSLLPEAQFIAQNPAPVNVAVSIPKVEEKPEWKLNGQVLTFRMEIRDNVSALKAKINDEIGIPPGKQKLQYDSFFMKDAMTMGYYNIMNGASIQLQLKERGGRKK